MRGLRRLATKVLQLSQGEFIAFLDSDDIWLPTKLERQMTLLQKVGESVPCCLCNIRMSWKQIERESFDIAALSPAIPEGIWLNVDEILATRFLLFNQGIVVRRNVLERIGGFDESLWLLEDHELALRLSLEGPWAFIRDALVVWRENSSGGSLYQTAQKEELRIKQPLVQILERHLAAIKDGHRYRTLRRHVGHELRSARRQLRVAKMATKPSLIMTVLAGSLRTMERYRRAIFVRSPWFPKMKVQDAAIEGPFLHRSDR